VLASFLVERKIKRVFRKDTGTHSYRLLNSPHIMDNDSNVLE